MLKIFVLSLSILLPRSADVSVQQRLERHPKVEAYEIRPGILAIPRYSKDNDLCEVGLERLHYSPELIRVDSTLSDADVDNVLAELVPADERGDRLKSPADGLITGTGRSRMYHMDFQNITVEIYGDVIASGRKNDTVTNVAATITWKKRPCR